LIPKHLRPDVREIIPEKLRPSIGSIIPYQYRPHIGELFRMKPVRITKTAAEDAAKALRLSSKSVVIVEGGERLKVYELEKYTALAEKSGAKLILVGDRPPEGKGTALGALAGRYGAVYIEPPEPRRVETKPERRGADRTEVSPAVESEKGQTQERTLERTFGRGR
jgi:hypothetical protein